MTKKEDILAQLLEDIVQRIMDRVPCDISASMPADQQLIRLIKAHVAGLCRYPEGKAFILSESHLLSQRSPEILAVRDQYQHLLESILQQGVEQGLFHIEDVKLTALAFLGALNWIPRWFAPDGRLSSEMIGDSYARLLMRALVMPEKGSPDSSMHRADEQ
ncbi:MAG: hypothetical protein IMW89_03995 [Ktedonobacteraceae bacterium]|nr:hypothetical protein [Ktedonobacteraceae bacterium]